EFLVQAAVPMLLGLYWKRGNKYGAFTGMIAGTLIIVLFIFFPNLLTWTGGVSSGLIAVSVNLILYITVSLATPRQNHVDNLFNAVENYNRKSENNIDKNASAF